MDGKRGFVGALNETSEFVFLIIGYRVKVFDHERFEHRM
jgi:hypothetical protein